MATVNTAQQTAGQSGFPTVIPHVLLKGQSGFPP